MTDLIARLEELRANVRGVYDDGTLMHDLGDETCEEDCRACAFDLEVQENFPAFLHALKVQEAAEVHVRAIEASARDWWPDEDSTTAFDVYETREALVRAVKGEQP